MKAIYRNLALTALLLCGQAATHAEDIDLFVGTTAASDLPNVLFVIDNTANWNTAFDNEMAALKTVFNGISATDGTARFNVGILLANETGNPNNNVAGGYIRAAMRPMTKATGILYGDMVASFDKLKDKGNAGKSSLQLVEAYRYFKAGIPYAGNGKVKTDFASNTCVGCNQSAAAQTANKKVYALPGNALSGKDGSPYSSFINANGCARNFIIYISNGPNQDSNSTETEANTALAAAISAEGVGSTTTIALSPTGSQSNPSDEWARLLKLSSLGVTTYAIDVNPPATGQGPGWTALMKSIAKVSNGGYTAVNSSSGADVIAEKIFGYLSQIQAVNSVFASVSLPVSVNTQGTYLNQVYVGMFRPDPGADPRWLGNLKQYRVGLSSNALRLQDASSPSPLNAVNPITGFIDECVKSFWSTSNSYWTFRPRGGCIGASDAATLALQVSDSPDGNIVEKGAQAQQLRALSARPLKTCSPVFVSCTATTDFNTANAAITQAFLGAGSSTERDQLIRWGRGVDIDDENTNASIVDIRASVHGDIVHSRPVAINFGSAASPAVVVFYGGNDGVLRAVNGNRSAAIGSVAAGGELWGFIPPEYYGQIKRLRDNNQKINFPNVTVPAASLQPAPKPYGFDGPVTAYKDNTNTWIYATMRRGGRALYAFNVNPGNPADITLKWKKGCAENFTAPGVTSDANCTTGDSGAWTGLGQSWAAPRTFRAAGETGPLLIMGGGYDTCEDSHPNTCSSPKGKVVYLLEANSGNLLRTFATDRSVAADVIVVPDAVTGLASFAYVVDLGGNIYRINIGSQPAANWTMTKIASLGCGTTATCTHNRKFMFAPDVASDNAGTYFVLVGSGDREKPLLYSNPVANYFFMVKDKPADNTWLASESGNCGSAIICKDSLLGITSGSTPTNASLAAKKGWYLGLAGNEQVVTSAITIFGTVTFSTHQPTTPVPGACTSNLGTARVYNISYLNAAPTKQTDKRFELLPPDIGLPPSPVAGLVTLDNGQTVPFCIGCSPSSPLEAEQPAMPPTSIPAEPKRRVYWYINAADTP